MVFVYAGGILLLFVAVGIVDKIQGMLGLSMSQQVTYDLRKDLHSHLQKMTFTFYDNKKTGELISRIIDDLNVVERMLYNIPRLLIRNVVTIILAVCFGGYLMRNKPSVALACFAVFPGVFFVYLFFFKRIIKAAHKVRKRKAALSSKTEDVISGMKIVQAFNKEDYEQDRFDRENTNHYKSRLEVISYQTSMLPYTLSLMGIALTIAASYGGYQVINGPLKVGALAGFIMYLQRFMGPLQMLAAVSDPASRFLAGIRRFFTYMDIQPDIKDQKNAVQLQQVKGKIEFKNIKFRYDEDQDILKNINFTVNPGQTVALVGPSGSGKSTITRLLPRFYEPYQGQILLDGTDIRNYSIRSLRDAVSIVMQERHLITDTVKQNIRYGKLNAQDNEIIEAAEKANASEFIENLAKGYDTQVGQRGAKLSQGQAQRLAIARAILKNAPILILDEATASVDSHTEKLIQQALDVLLKNKTAFIIAHRLSTIKNADKILFIEDGQIIEQGSHQQLMDKNGKYANFHNIQFKTA
jgi:ATP-binding cassette subfamily B protein